MSIVSKGSSLLSEKENQSLQCSIGDYNLVEEVAITQLYLADKNRQWIKFKTAGVICYIKDYSKKSFFLRYYISDKNSSNDISFEMVWEQELYREFNYFDVKPFFHIFPAHDCYAGLNFACEKEAVMFSSVILERISLRNKRAGQTSTISSKVNTFSVEPVVEHKVLVPDRRGKSESKSKVKRKVTKKDIGIPVDFRHIEHVGPESKPEMTCTKQPVQPPKSDKPDMIYTNKAVQPPKSDKPDMIYTNKAVQPSQSITSLRSDSDAVSQMLRMMAGKDMKNEDISFLYNFIKEHGVEKVAEQLKSESKIPELPRKNRPASLMDSSTKPNVKPRVPVRKAPPIGFIHNIPIPEPELEDVYSNCGMPTPFNGNVRTLYPPPNPNTTPPAIQNQGKKYPSVQQEQKHPSVQQTSASSSPLHSGIPPPPPLPPPFVESDTNIVINKKPKSFSRSSSINEKDAPKKMGRSKSFVENADDGKNLVNALWFEIDKRYQQMNVHMTSDVDSDFE